jgi:hypothetical protein
MDSDWITDLFAMEITTAQGYNYDEHYRTRSFSDPTDGTALRRRLASIPEINYDDSL